MTTYYVDGKFVSAADAVIPIDDLAVLRGFGIFDLLRTHGGKPLFLEEHIERLLRSAQQLDLRLPWSRGDLIDVVRQTLARNRLPEAIIRIVVTGGSSPDFITPQGRPRLLVLVSAKPQYPREWYTEGVKIITVAAERRIPGAKSIDYIPATMAIRQAKRVNAVEALYVEKGGNVLECTTSNIFAFHAQKLITPGRGILSGITRQAVLKVARDLCPLEIRDLKLSDLLQASEVFITGTSKDIVPVVQIDDAKIGSGRPGEKTRRIIEAFGTYVDRLVAEA
jgi:branched-chain amino acid aminotransferase